jgi:aldehyde dehydrogenase (NAD+)
MQIIGRSVGAALAMGNACVVKPAEEACLTALAFAALAEKAGFPAGAVNVVPGLGEEAGAALAGHPGVNHISFTGSVGVGALVQAAAARNVVPVTLELGGKSPQVVFADADLDAALPFLVNAGIQNAGQTCSASSRIVVERAVHDEVVERMAARYRALRVGPAAADLDVGPLISARQKEIVEGYLGLGRRSGGRGARRDRGERARGRALRGAASLAGRGRSIGWRGRRSSARAGRDPLRGRGGGGGDRQRDGLRACRLGLEPGRGAADAARAALHAGQVFVNNYGAGGGVELPFGGVGRSGHGREKGFEALYGFSALKTVAAFHG